MKQKSSPNQISSDQQDHLQMHSIPQTGNNNKTSTSAKHITHKQRNENSSNTRRSTLTQKFVSLLQSTTLVNVRHRSSTMDKREQNIYDTNECARPPSINQANNTTKRQRIPKRTCTYIQRQTHKQQDVAQLSSLPPMYQPGPSSMLRKKPPCQVALYCIQTTSSWTCVHHS